MAKNKFNPLKILIGAILVYLIGEILLTSFYYFKARSDVKTAEKEVVTLTQENKELNDKIKELNTAFTIEKIARESLCLAKPNETVIYFKNTETPTAVEETEKSNFFQKALKNLLKLFQK
jgi:cell division protein FtsB